MAPIPSETENPIPSGVCSKVPLAKTCVPDRMETKAAYTFLDSAVILCKKSLASSGFIAFSQLGYPAIGSPSGAEARIFYWSAVARLKPSPSKTIYETSSNLLG